jgi:hypothetical protein
MTLQNILFFFPINSKGLLALGKVITALNSKNVSHIPHRESILTRALKGSIFKITCFV